MRGILKNTLLLLGGMALGSLATRRAIRYVRIAVDGAPYLVLGHRVPPVYLGW